jgi:hypothetical protein
MGQQAPHQRPFQGDGHMALAFNTQGSKLLLSGSLVRKTAAAAF